MARSPRVIVADGLYHVTTRTPSDRVAYVDDGDREWFLEHLARTVARFELTCVSYCLMRTHYHVIVATPKPNLDAAIRRLNGVYAQYFNKRRNRHGCVWGGRYASTLIQSERHHAEVGRYVALNPKRAGHPEPPEAYAWSSYGATIGVAAAAPFVDDARLLEPFGRTGPAARRRFRAFVEEADPRRRWGQTRA